MAKKRFMHEILDDDPLKRPTRSTNSGKSHNGDSTTLFMGELALGTKGSDERVYLGSASFLEANNLYKDIGHVVASGGLLPFIPTYYGVQNAREMAFLGNNWDQGISDRAKLILDSDIPTEDKNFIEKWVAYKITNTSQAVNFVSKTLKPLTEILRDATWHYLHGEEDGKNIGALEEININNYIDQQEEDQKVHEKKIKLEQDLQAAEERLRQYDLQEKLLKQARHGIHHTYNRKKVNDYLKGFLKDKEKDIEALENPDDFVKILDKISSRKNVSDKIEKLELVAKDMRRDYRGKERELKDAINSVNARSREREAKEFHRITKRRHIQPDEKEFLGWEAKNEYNRLIYDCLEEVDLKVHSGHGVDLILDGVMIGLAHKAKLGGNAPGMSELKEVKGLVKRISRVGRKVPVINAVFHGSGGFRHEAINADAETIENYVERVTPQTTMVVQFPTMQSEDQLRALWKKNVKNVHTQRWQKGNYSSGQVIYTVRGTGEHEIMMITEPQMIKYAEIKEKIDLLSDQRKKPGTSNGKKARNNKKIKNLENELKWKPKKGLVLTDIHFGSPSKEGRPSNYDVFASVMKYIEGDGIPDLLVVNGDIVHGALKKHFGTNEQQYARQPYQVRQVVEGIKKSNLSPLEKMAALEHLATRELSQMGPLPIIDQQYREAKVRLVPLMHKVLDYGGHVLVTSGNHGNETSRSVDEATGIINLVDLKYLDNPNLREFVGLGEKDGLGEATLENGWKVYCAHRPGRASDKVAGSLRTLDGINSRANLGVFGHVHQPGGGHGGGSFVIVGPGMQTWTPFLNQVGMAGSLRGAMGFEYDTKHPGVFKWKYILDQTLERDEYSVKG